MRKMAAGLVFTMVMGSGVAWAVPVGTVTGGSIVLFDLDTVMSFGGDGFSVEQSDGKSQGRLPFSGPPGSLISETVSFDSSFGSVSVRVGTTVCEGVGDDPPAAASCGTMTLANFGLPPPPADLLLENYSASGPFIASGHLDVGEGLDIVGQGTVTEAVCFNNTVAPCDRAGFFISYVFFSPPTSVSEPATLLLTLAALGVLVGALFLRDRWHRSCWTPRS
jgi:hypothetical protein